MSDATLTPPTAVPAPTPERTSGNPRAVVITAAEAARGQSLTREVDALVARSQGVRIVTADDYSAADALLVEAATAVKDVGAFCDGSVDNPGPLARAHRAWKSLTEWRATLLEPLAGVRMRVAQAMAAWKAEQDRLTREREREAARLEQERQRNEQLEVAAALEREGLKDEAAAVVAEAIVAPAPVVTLPTSVPKVATTFRDVAKFEVIDASMVPREYLMVDEAKVGRVVKATNGTVAIPGVRVWVDKVPNTRTATK